MLGNQYPRHAKPQQGTERGHQSRTQHANKFSWASSCHNLGANSSKDKLQCDLHDTVIVGPSYITETTLAGVVDEPIRVRKLRVVEDIECFCPKLQLSVLGNGSTL